MTENSLWMPTKMQHKILNEQKRKLKKEKEKKRR